MAEISNSIERESLCKHQRSTPGCDACRLVDYKIECDEAIDQRGKCYDILKTEEARLADPALSDAQRESIQHALRMATSQVALWDERLKKLGETVELCLESVVMIQSDDKPELWARKFHELAETKAWHQNQHFRSVYTEATAGKFREEDPSSDAPFTGLDRSKIPAMADCLLSEGTGLEMFLRAGRYLGPNRTARLPTTAVGEHLRPAFMSPGRAIHMFQLPEDPGVIVEEKSEESMFQLSEDSGATSLPDALQHCSVSPPPADEDTPARTERERKEQNSEHRPTASTMTEEEQWNKLDRTRYMAYTSLLANKYNRLASTGWNEAQAVVNKDGEEGSAEQSTNARPSHPASFAGFANWIAENERAHTKKVLGLQILPKWKKDYEMRNEELPIKVKGALAKLRPTDEMIAMQPPTQHTQQLPSLQKDLKELKIKTNVK